MLAGHYRRRFGGGVVDCKEIFTTSNPPLGGGRKGYMVCSVNRDGLHMGGQEKRGRWDENVNQDR